MGSNSDVGAVSFVHDIRADGVDLTLAPWREHDGKRRAKLHPDGDSRGQCFAGSANPGNAVLLERSRRGRRKSRTVRSWGTSSAGHADAATSLESAGEDVELARLFEFLKPLAIFQRWTAA